MCHGPTKRPAHIVRCNPTSSNDEHIRPANRAQALNPVEKFETYPLESNAERQRQATPHPEQTGLRCGMSVDCFRGKRRDVVARPDIRGIREEVR